MTVDDVVAAVAPSVSSAVVVAADAIDSEDVNAIDSEDVAAPVVVPLPVAPVLSEEEKSHVALGFLPPSSSI